jgi:S1-C subfamily serine protease
MADNPDHQIVVLAGVQHIIYNNGIPKRTHRLNKKDYATLINGEFDELTMDIGDFVLFPSHISAPPSPKLGVFLEEEDGKVKIEKFAPKSVADKAGLKKGDTFISIEEWGIESIADVKISLFDKKHGQTIKVKALRKKFPFGQKELEFVVTL